MSHTRFRAYAVFALTFALSACSKESASGGTSGESAAKVEQDAATQVGDAVAQALPADVAKAAEQAKANPPGAPNGDPVDVCALVDTKDIEALVGPLMQGPTPMKPQGSLLGGCDWMSKSITMVSVSARPATEYKDTVAYASKKEPAKPVAGLGSEAASTSAGLFVLPGNKPYFFQVLAMPKGKSDPELAANIARKIML